MAIRFTCPHCAAVTDVAEEFAGQSGPCARCGKEITVPPLPGTPGYSPPKKRSQGPILVLVAGAIAVGVFLVCGGGALFFWRLGTAPMPVTMSTAVPQSSCVENLRQIGLAMQSYHDRYGSFPPAYVADEDGKPMHSWRVLLLPYLGEQWVYDQYDFNEPWDGPHNRSLAGLIPGAYHCPDDFGAAAEETTYVMIVGRETISDGPTGRSTEEITDGTARTILLVETSHSGINWLEPRDLPADRISYRINDGTPRGIRSNHPGTAHVLLADGSVQALDVQIDAQTVRAMSTIAAGDDVSGFSDR